MQRDRNVRSLIVSIETLRNEGLLGRDEEMQLKQSLKLLSHSLQTRNTKEIRVNVNKIAHIISCMVNRKHEK